MPYRLATPQLARCVAAGLVRRKGISPDIPGHVAGAGGCGGGGRMERFDVVVLGAGAAGMMAAIEAGRRGRRVLVVEQAAAPGEKIRISGGGRCNFTNLGIAADRFLSQNPRFALSALKRFTEWDFIARIDRAGIGWHEKTLGQLFCDGSATQVVAMLRADMAAAGVVLWLGCSPGEVAHDGSGFTVATPRGMVRGTSLVVATGGKSIPKLGSAFGYRIAERFGLRLLETRPGLVPLSFAPQELAWMQPLAGVALPVRASAGKVAFEEAALFTHRGLSGPAVLQISSYWREGMPIALNLLPGQDALALLQAEKTAYGRQAVRTVLARHLPERLARHLDEVSGLSGPLAEQSMAKLTGLAALLSNWHLMPVGSEGYRTAEVTLGGIDTDGLDARTMMARAVPGLFFIGDVVDVTGWLGGYNFQWAWSSGWAAGQVA